MRTYVMTALGLAGVLFLPGTVLATAIELSPLVPPADGVYRTSQQAEYMGAGLDVILKDIQHHGFTNIVRTPGGGNTIETFDSILDGDGSVNGSPFLSFSLSGPVTVDVFGYTPGDLGTFNTEMLALNLTGTLLGNPVMVRESPTLASTGQTTIANLGGGLFQIDSFFDVFTELSVDGGQSWIPSQGPERVQLEAAAVPEPASLFLLGSGLVAVVRRLRKR